MDTSNGPNKTLQYIINKDRHVIYVTGQVSDLTRIVENICYALSIDREPGEVAFSIEAQLIEQYQDGNMPLEEFKQQWGGGAPPQLNLPPNHRMTFGVDKGGEFFEPGSVYFRYLANDFLGEESFKGIEATFQKALKNL